MRAAWADSTIPATASSMHQDGTAVPAKRRNVPGNEQIPEEAIFLLEIDNNITKYREEFPVKKDRREELYRKLGST